MPELLYNTPTPSDTDLEVLQMIEDLQLSLADRVVEPRRWAGSLRRTAFVRAVQGSNSIEGYNATLDDVRAVVDDEPVLSASEQTVAALEGYRDALTFVLQAAEGETAIDEGIVKALHYMMLRHEPGKSPGQWRRGEIFVEREGTGERVYEGPDAERLPALTSACFAAVATDTSPALVRAAMAHLNFVMIHPFRDGNGRMARCLQTFVIAASGIRAPVFSSIEEYLGRNTPAYYEVLEQVGQGVWNPAGDARPWVEFCLTAHYRQMATLARRIGEAEALWAACLDLVHERKLPSRSVGPLMEMAYGFRMRNAQYRSIVERSEGDEITTLVASRDLQALAEAGVVEPVGERRGRYYLPGPPLAAMAEAARRARAVKDLADPYDVVRGGRQLRLDA